MDQIFGIVERITFHNVENGFTVARLQQPRKKELTTLVGKLPPLQPGESVRCQGTWKMSPAHGMQFEATTCHVEEPSDVAGIEKYLASGMVRGIGPVYAERIVKKFGIKTLEIIDQQPDLLQRIPGIGQKRLETIKTCWQEQKSVREVMVFLQKYQISPAFAQKIYKKYGEEAIARIQENPYTLAKEIPGLGFKSVDRIATSMEFPKEGTQRVDAGIDYILSEMGGEGHVCCPTLDLLDKAELLLEVPRELVEQRLDALIETEQLYLEEELVYPKGLYLCESGIARELRRVAEGKSRLRGVDTEKAVVWVEEQLSMELAENQKQAVAHALSDKVHIITGGPGTGKSTITKAILRITEKLTRRIALAAPTGRAAKRMTEITRRDASTIHSLLQFQGTGFRRNRELPLDCDLLIVDEASMIDTSLMYHLLRAVPTEARLLLIGDIHQLPSVGPGNVLQDLIESDKVPVTALTEIFRQAAHSKIITNAHKINRGDFPDLETDPESDFFFVKAEEPEEVVEKIVTLNAERLPKRYRLDPINQIQVLSPMKRGEFGIDNLNRVLQKVLNPQKEGVEHMGRRFSLGDKVMQIRNNYQKEVYNGDIGRIASIDPVGGELVVAFEQTPVPYSLSDLDELVLAYATSIHKYQGSECPCVIIPVHTSHFVMLHRNLLYTGVTRGKRLVVLVGTGKAIAIAIGNDEVKKRHTGLRQKMIELFQDQANGVT